MFERIKPLFSADELKSRYPLPSSTARFRADCVRKIKDILCGTDNRKIFIVGPCSADDPQAVYDYAVRMKRVAEKIESRIFTVMRVYTAKPRSRGDGYMGLIHSPDPSANTDFAAGLAAMRKLHLRINADCELPTADEIVYPEVLRYIDDVPSYFTIGARTAEDPTHRFVAGGLDIPVGIKNPINGNIFDLIDSVRATRIANEFIFGGDVVRTSGNMYSHAILRGAVDKNGNHVPNCGYDSVMYAAETFNAQNIKACVIVDTGHSNSAKDPMRVGDIVSDIVKSCKNRDYNTFVKGVMIESYLLGGRKSVGERGYGQSITDPCLSIDDTERILLDAAATLEN